MFRNELLPDCIAVGMTADEFWLQRVELSMQQNLYSDNSHSAVQIRQLHDRIQRLDVVDRAIILLWLEDMSYEEIAAIVGISVKNLSVKLVRIKEQLKQNK